MQNNLSKTSGFSSILVFVLLVLAGSDAEEQEEQQQLEELQQEDANYVMDLEEAGGGPGDLRDQASHDPVKKVDALHGDADPSRMQGQGASFGEADKESIAHQIPDIQHGQKISQHVMALSGMYKPWTPGRKNLTGHRRSGGRLAADQPADVIADGDYMLDQ